MSLYESQNVYDILISGAGPAGLTAGILAARTGLRVLICEKEQRVGTFPRGETVHDHPIFTEILGDQVLARISHHQTAARKFNSSDGVKSFELFRKTSSFVFHWDDFITILYQQALRAGVLFRFETEIVSPLIEAGKCIGCLTHTQEQLGANTVLACDGHTSQIGQFVGIPYHEMNNPIMKCVISNWSGQYSGFEYYFLTRNPIPEISPFLPSILYFFPRGNQQCEIGWMILSEFDSKSPRSAQRLEENNIQQAWTQLKLHYPPLISALKNVTIDFEGLTAIPAAKLYNSPMPMPGLAFIGDSLGFIEASGASGISTSMQLAQLTVNFLTARQPLEWNITTQDQYINSIRNTPLYHHVESVYRKTKLGKRMIFRWFGTPYRMDRYWEVIQRLYTL